MSKTQTQTKTQTKTKTITTVDNKKTEEKILLLDLQLKKEVTWTEDTVNIDENSGKRKSKNCCIFSKKNRYEDSDTLTGESEDE